MAWGERVQSFKVGPDYLDPQLHRWVTGRGCPNLDTVLTSGQYVHQCYAYHTQEVDYALVEGVMGLFDGPNSTAAVAKLLGLPVVLVVDCRRLSGSVAALVQGYAGFDPEVRVAGVILNQVASDRHSELLRAALAPLGIPIMGECRRQEALHYPERHLGLLSPAERGNLSPWRAALITLGQRCFDWERLRPLLQVHNKGTVAPPWSPLRITQPLTLAVAWDEAFSFYYDEQLALLRAAGVGLYFWSPLRDAPLSPEVGGLILGGGYPELWAETLSQRQDVLQNLRQRITQGLPVYAECGGLMFLGKTLITLEGTSWPLVGAMPLVTQMTQRLTLGYRQIKATADTCFVSQGEVITGHEFHYSQAVPPQDIYSIANVHATYLHCHWGAYPQQVQRFLDRIQQPTAQVV